MPRVNRFIMENFQRSCYVTLRSGRASGNSSLSACQGWATLGPRGKGMHAERSPQADDSLLAAPLLAVTQWGLHAPATVLVGACALALAAIAITVNGLTFRTSRLDLLNPRSEYNQRWLAYLSEFGDRDD